MDELPNLGLGGCDDTASSSPFPKAQKLDSDGQMAATLFGSDGLQQQGGGNGGNNNNSPFDDFGGGCVGNGGGPAKSGGLLAQALMEKKPPRPQATTLNARSPPFSYGASTRSPDGGEQQQQQGHMMRDSSREVMQRINDVIKNTTHEPRKRQEALNEIFREHPTIYKTIVKVRRGQQQQRLQQQQQQQMMSPMNNGYGMENGFDQQQQQPWGQNGMGRMQHPQQGNMGQPQRFMSPQQPMGRFPMGPMQQQQQSQIFQNGNNSGMEAMWDQQQYQQQSPSMGPRARMMHMQQQQGPPPSYPYGGRMGPRIRAGMASPIQMMQQQGQMGPGYHHGEYMMNGGGPMMANYGQPMGGDFGGRSGMMDGGMYQQGTMGMRPSSMAMANGPGAMSPAARMNLMQQQQQSQMCQQQQQQEPFMRQQHQDDLFLPQEGNNKLQQQQSFSGSFSVSDQEKMSGGTMMPANNASGSSSMPCTGGGHQDAGFGGMGQPFCDDGRTGFSQQQDQWKSSAEFLQHRAHLKSRLLEQVKGNETLMAESERMEAEAFARSDSLDSYNQECALWLAGLFQRGALSGGGGGGGASDGNKMAASDLPQELNATATEALQAAEAAAEKPEGGKDFFSSPSPLSQQKGVPTSPPSAISSNRRSLSEQNPILSKLLPAAPGAVASSPASSSRLSVDAPDLEDKSSAIPPTSSTSSASPSASTTSVAPASSTTPSSAEVSSSSLSPSDTPLVSSAASASTSTTSSSLKTLPSAAAGTTFSSSSEGGGGGSGGSFQSPPSFPLAAKYSPEEPKSSSPPQSAQRSTRRPSGASAGSKGSQQQQPFSVDSGFGSPRSNTSTSLCSPKIQGTSPSLVPTSESSPEK